MARDDDSLLSRWSRRKRGLDAEAPSGLDIPAPAHPPEKVTQETDEALTEPDLLKKLGLPDPDTLTSGDDFKAFMAKHVPNHLRQRALRRLWTSNPVLANLDGLVDHGEDYTDAATVPAVLKTAYQVGTGFVRQAVAARPDDDAAPKPEAPEDDTTLAIAPAEPQESAETTATNDDPPPPQPRRMAFRTD